MGVGTNYLPTALESTPVWNPAFDVTEAKLVDGYILDCGLIPGEAVRSPNWDWPVLKGVK